MFRFSYWEKVVQITLSFAALNLQLLMKGSLFTFFTSKLRAGKQETPDLLEIITTPAVRCVSPHIQHVRCNSTNERSSKKNWQRRERFCWNLGSGRFYKQAVDLWIKLNPRTHLLSYPLFFFFLSAVKTFFYKCYRDVLPPCYKVSLISEDSTATFSLMRRASSQFLRFLVQA